MARRMGKTADDQYMGGGTGNWKGAPKAPAKKATTTTTRSAPPKPKPKPSKPAAAKSGATYGSPKSKVRDGGATTRSLSSKSEVKAPTRSLSPKQGEIVGFPLGTASLKRSAKSRHAFSRSASSRNARWGATSREAQEYRKSQKPKPQSRSGEMVLGGGPKTSQAEKLKRTRGFGRK